MSKSQFRFRIGRSLAGVALLCVTLLAACEDEVAPGPVPVDIEIVSGDDQYSKQGTELEEPVVVQVVLSDGEVGIGVPVRFVVRSGGGTLSRTTANTNSSGETSVRWTLGPGLGTQEITVELADDGEVETIAQATSAVFFCPEEDPTFTRRFFAENDIFLFTRKSTVIAGGGPERAGVVQLLDPLDLDFGATSLVGFDETFIQAVVRDCAFSASGEFFIAWMNTSAVREIAKIAPDRSVTHFATLEGILGTEITIMEGAVLAGCDEFGPFTVGCRDSLTRYADATFDGTVSLANSDAVAYDNAGNYLYFIDETGRRLRRVPLDGFTQTGPTEERAVLTTDEATGTNGMVVHNGTVYMLVESATTKAIVAVTSADAKSTVLDFISERGAGAAAGIQSDLALLDNPPALFTLDTLNNVMLIYVINEDRLEVSVPEGVGNAGAASNGSSSGERVGLAVLP